MLRKIRIVFAVLAMLAVTVLFLDFTGVAHHYLSWMAKVQLVPAILSVNVVALFVLSLLTIIGGRLYCSVICPLGIMQDIIAYFGKLKKKNRYTYSKRKKILRVSVLAAYAICVLLGVGVLITLLDPYAAYGRIANSLLQPLYELGNNLLAAIAEHYDSYAFYRVDVWIKSALTLSLAVVTLVAIAILAWRNGRTYCNTICPVGTLLGFVSRYSMFRPMIDTSKCNGCTLCQRNCKAACINSKEHKIDHTRCVVCGDCIEKCNRGALNYKFAWTKSKTSDHGAPADPQKRAFMATAAIMAASAATKAQEKVVDGGYAVILDKERPQRETPIVPAGSVSLRSFESHCTGCQLCVSACPNGVLRPGLIQPEMSYERGYCRPECTRCSEVCPAGAISLIDRVEKSSTQIGHAVWVKKNCVVLTDDVNCGNCARHCPSGAISMVPSVPDDPKSRKIPVVDENRCIGCGACENLCPARPFSAIYVEGHEVHKTI